MSFCNKAFVTVDKAIVSLPYIICEVLPVEDQDQGLIFIGQSYSIRLRLKDHLIEGRYD